MLDGAPQPLNALMRIAILEDDFDSRRAGSLLLTKLGYEVVSGGSLAEL